MRRVGTDYGVRKEAGVKRVEGHGRDRKENMLQMHL